VAAAIIGDRIRTWLRVSGNSINESTFETRELRCGEQVPQFRRESLYLETLSRRYFRALNSRTASHSYVALSAPRKQDIVVVQDAEAVANG
jgi:hypothetical protein